MRYLFLVGFILAACTSLPSHQGATRTPAQSSSRPYDVVAPSIPRLNFNRLLEISKNSSTLEEALRNLSTQYPEYLRLHTLVYDSASIQKATFKEPRALVFGPDAKFVFTFNGAQNGGGGSFETMEYDEREAKFKFREIAFKKQIPEDEKWVYSPEFIQNQTDNILWSKVNPQRCTQCHGADPTPIWDTYFLWPGVYGSDDDLLTVTLNRTTASLNLNYIADDLTKQMGSSLGRQFELRPRVKDVEAEGFKKYLISKHAREPHPRFRFLPDRPGDKAFMRWMNGAPENVIDSHDDVEKQKAVLGPSHFTGSVDTPNSYLLALLSSLNAKRFIHDAALKPSGAILPYLLIYKDFCVDPNFHISQYPPPPTVENFERYFRPDPILGLEKYLSATEIASIRERSWPEFSREMLVEELDMESDKLYRMERDFGSNSIKKTKFSESSITHRPTEAFFTSLGINLNRYNRLVCGEEAGQTYAEAANAYLARGFDFDLKNYVTNMRRARTFHGNRLADMLASRLLPPYELETDTCPQLTEILSRLSNAK